MRNISKYILRTALIAAIFVMGEGVMWGGSNGYAAKMTVAKTGEGSVYVRDKDNKDVSSYQESGGTTSGGEVTFTLTATPASGYHFKAWTFQYKDHKEGMKAYEASALQNGAVTVERPTIEIYTSSTKNGQYYNYIKEYTATATFEQNVYYASLSAQSGGNGTISVVTSSPQSKTESGGYVEFELDITPDKYYHLDLLTFTSEAKGETVIQDGRTYAKVKLPEGDNYGEDNAINYSITATFARDTYTVHFDKNDGGRGVQGDQMPDQMFQSKVKQAISKNEYVLNHTVTYDANGGKVNSQDTLSETKTRFTRWKAYYEGDYNTEIHTDIEFTDGKIISLEEEHGAKLVFKATWADKLDFLFPDAKLGDRSMDGWFYSKTPEQGTVPKGLPGDIVSMTTATLYAKWGDPFYASMSLVKTKGASADPSADYGILSSDNKNSNLTFNLTAAAPAEGYHFTGWTDASEGVKMASLTPSGTDPLKATAIVKSSQTAGESNANQYKARANYEINTYYASLVADACENGHIIIVTESPQSDTVSGGFVEFELSIEPVAGYHCEELAFTSTLKGEFVKKEDGKTYARVQVPEGENYGVEKALNYSIRATFPEDKYYAKLTVAASQAGTGPKTGVARVKKDNEYVTDPVVKSATTSGGAVTFNIQAIPETGYQLLGWATSDNSTDYVTITDSTYTVNGHTTEGQTLEYSLFAVFGHGTYTVKFDGNGAASGSMEDEEFTHGTPQKLTKLGFVNDFTLTFNTQGGNQIDPVTKSRFTYWSDGENTYSDEQEIDSTVNHGSKLTFTATWAESLEFKLPTPVKTAEDGSVYTFHGWYDSAIGGKKVGDGGETVNIDATQTLYAHWQQYNIVVKANDGQKETGDKAVFNVVRAGTPATSYRISVPIGGPASSRTLSDVAPGKWTVTPVGIWSWKYVTPDAQTKESLSEETTTFEFVFTPKESVKKKNDETSKTKDYTKSN